MFAFHVTREVFGVGEGGGIIPSTRIKIVLRWNDTPFVPIWYQIKRE